MANILNIETSSQACSAALTCEGMVVCDGHTHQSHSHASALSGFIKKCLDHARQHQMGIDAVAVSIGPGSYTGLRIGLSEAKGLAYALSVPLIGVDTLKLLAVTAMFALHETRGDELLVPMMDARRMEVYTAAYDMGLKELLPPQALVLDTAGVEKLAAVGSKGSPLFFGDGSEKARLLLEPLGWRHLGDIEPLAANMLALSDLAYARGEFLNLAYSVPTYLKEFQGTKPRLGLAPES